MTTEEIVLLFRQKNLRATPQRIAVYDFLLKNRIHPSAEDVYKGLILKNPTFSRTTIYNSLNALVENGLAITVKIGENMLRYDGCVDLHGHFICRECKKIYDFDVDSLSVSGLSGFIIKQKDVYFSGICAGCGKQNKIIKE